MTEERFTAEEAMAEAERMQKMVGPKGEKGDYDRAQEVIESLPHQRFRTRLMAKISPDSIDSKLYTKAVEHEKSAAEAKRREELGPKGRIREDVEKSIKEVFDIEKSYDEAWKKFAKKGGKMYGKPYVYEEKVPRPLEVGPFKESHDSFVSGTVEIREFLSLNHLTDDNIIGHLQGEQFCFGTGLDESDQMSQDDEGGLRVCLISLEEDGVAADAIELTDDFLDSLSEEDTRILELAAGATVNLIKKIAIREDRVYRHTTENLP